MARPTEIVSKLAGKAQAAISAIAGEKGIFRRLKEEHVEVTVLMMRIARSHDPTTRRELFPRIRAELLAHAKGEQAEFYSVLAGYATTRDLAHHAQAEHTEIESMLDQLRTADMASDEWGETFERMMKLVEEHVMEEEDRLFPEAKRVVTDEDALRIERRYLERKLAERKDIEH